MSTSAYDDGPIALRKKQEEESYVCICTSNCL